MNRKKKKELETIPVKRKKLNGIEIYFMNECHKEMNIEYMKIIQKKRKVVIQNMN